LNSWAGDWGKSGYAWVPSEMIDDAIFAFAAKTQQEVYFKLLQSGELRGKKWRFEMEEN